MPRIAIGMYSGRTEEKKADLAKKVKDLMVQELGVEEQYVVVSIQDIEREDWEEAMKQFPEGTVY